LQKGKDITFKKKKIKAILEAVRAWSAAREYPFFFSTEASINLADDEELLELMRKADFRYVFIGLETTDAEVLALTKKRINLQRRVIQDLHKIYRYGMVVNGGFIIGFDQETRASARSIPDAVSRGKICMAMIGLLYALPGTQLTRRLVREGRMNENTARIDGMDETAIDQTIAGLNFITGRARN